MRRLLAFLLALTLLGSLSLAPVAAQDDDATPEADGTPRAGGEETILVDDRGDELAAITVEDVIDPFEDFAEFFTPEEDARYVAIEVTVENLDQDDDVFAVDPYPFQLTDEDGFVYTYTFVSREDDAEPAELESTEIEPGDSTSGLLFYAVPEDVDLDTLYYNSNEQLLQLADLSDL